jgi:DNA-binding CsgD family transcriptional regulator
MAVVHLETRRIHFANALAQGALQAATGLHGGLYIADDQLRTTGPADTMQLERAMTQARCGLRALLRFDASGSPLTIALVPLAFSAAPQLDAADARRSTEAASFGFALLVFAKQQLCDGSTVTLYARERGLTSMEGQVLASVCRGLRPNQIANQHGVQISTVRTQLRSIRQKTQTDTIRELVQQVSVLPPMARHFAGHPASAAAPCPPCS